jgi:alpha-L-fucosidase 2
MSSKINYMILRSGENQMKLHYDNPAKEWTEALPLGNGRLGAMVFGGVETEHLQINEDTLWSGGPRDWNNPKAIEALPDVRRLLEQGRYMEADERCRDMMGLYTQSYLPFGDLFLKFDHGALSQGYRRSLELDEAISRVEYRIGSISYTREMFISHPDQIAVIRLTASRPGAISVHANLQSDLRYGTSASDGQFVLQGFAPENVDPSYYATDEPIRYGSPDTTDAMRFEGRLGALHEDGTMRIDHDGIHILGASSVTFLMSAATSFNGFDRSPGREGKDPSAAAAGDLSRAMKLSYPELRARHVNDYQSLFRRVELSLGSSGKAAPEELSTDRRIAEYGAADPGLVELLFHYGRYLMIASSRPGTQPTCKAYGTKKRARLGAATGR